MQSVSLDFDILITSLKLFVAKCMSDQSWMVSRRGYFNINLSVSGKTYVAVNFAPFIFKWNESIDVVRHFL